MDTLWIYFLLFIILLTVFSYVGIRRESCTDYRDWCNNIMLENNFDPPEIHIFRAKKNSCVKVKSGVAYIYLARQGSELADKKMLTYLLASLTTDKYVNDCQYHTNLEVLMDAFENKENIRRVNVKTIN